MSNAKIRARRRRRARRGWEKSTGFVYYYDTETLVMSRGQIRPPTNAERQAEGSDHAMRELSRQLWAVYPGALQIHDELLINVPVVDAEVLRAQMIESLRAWNRFGSVSSNFLKNWGDPITWDDTSEHPKAL
jgi:hypothetical protein